MSQFSDLLLKQVTSAASNVSIPSNLKNQVLGGLSDSILGSLTQTAAKAGGVDTIKQLLTGKANAASSPVTALAGKLFASNIAGKLNLNSATSNALTAVIPTVIGKLSGFIKDQDGDGDIDINDIIMTLTGGGKGKGSILGAATSILGGILKK